MVSHFWDVYRDIRSVIQKPEDAHYVLHTPLGAIAVRRFIYRAESGYVVLQGIDEAGKAVVVGFSEQQLSTFPMEIRNAQIRPNLNQAESPS